VDARPSFHRAPQIVLGRPDTVPTCETTVDQETEVVTNRFHSPYYYYEEPKDLKEAGTRLDGRGVV
ncbi:MAG: hypothetical protein ACRD3V_34555, partial [Vicinamibacteria bacterium]